MNLLLLLLALAGPGQATEAGSTDLGASTGAAGLGAPAGPVVTHETVVAERTRAITAGLRCPVCQGLSAADSQAESAVAMCTRTDELVRQGYSDDQIRAWFVDRYGEWVLLEPPRQGRHWLVWLGPLVVVGVGAGVVAGRLRAAGRSEPPPEGGRDDTPELTPAQRADPYVRRVLADLEEA